MTEDGEEMARRAFRVVGRVQGVGFRWWTRRTAQELGLGGWVRNEVDGSVVVHGVGSAGALERLAEALEDGPASARVDTVQEITPGGALVTGEFRIEA
ncbi:MAG: acylphosphatase [Gemmatimonadota bacterium]|jgi:acylphosphatase